MPRPERLRRYLAWLLVAFVSAAPATARDALECLPRSEHAVTELPATQRRGLLWEVTSPGGAIGHLLGTIHLSSAEVTTLSPQLRATLAASERFGMEVVFDMPTLTALGQSMRAPDGAGLAADADPVLYARTLELLAPYGIDANTARGLKTWAVYTTLSLPPGQDGPPLDLKLMTIARQAGKPLFGIETLAEQMTVFDSLSIAEQVALLRETVCHYAQQQQEVRAIVAAYARRDLAAIYRDAMRYDSAAQTRLMDTLLDERNARMAERMRPRFDLPGTFIAVGALHLPGPGGLIERLTVAGYRLRPIDL